MAAKKIDRRLAAAAIAAVAVYLGLAYVLAPFFWRHFEHQPKLAGFEATTRTALGLPGDAINVGLEGPEDDVLCAMHAAGWRPADPVTLSSSVRIVGSVLLDRPYLDAPVSPLFYENRKQDLAFEKPSGKSARTRHHVRFWKALDAGGDGLPAWLGAAVFDDGLGVSHYTGQVTHHTAPDIDAERDFLMSDLEHAKKVEEIYSVSGVGPTLFSRNGGGDPYFTDGDIAFARLVSGCEGEEGTPRTLLEPPRIVAKNALFARLAALWHRVHGPWAAGESWRGAFNRSPCFGNRSIRARRRKGNPRRRERVAQRWSPCRHAIRPRTARPGRSRRR